MSNATTHCPERKAAEDAHNTALLKQRQAEDISESAFDEAVHAANITRRHLIDMEARHPTHAERKRDSQRHYLASRGLDY